MTLAIQSGATVGTLVHPVALQQSQPGVLGNEEPSLESLRAVVAASEQALSETREAPSNSSTHLWSPSFVMYLGGGLLVFGLIICVLMSFLLKREKSPDQVLRTLCVPLIIIVTVFLVIVGYTDQQIAPVIGLLGTIAGYLLGRSESGRAAPTEVTK